MPLPSGNASRSGEEAERVRRAIGALWQSTLGALASEFQACKAAGEPLSKAFVYKLKVASDQLRLDYRLDVPAEAEAPAATERTDPLEGLRIVG